jgi:transglutaminase-like putative cysteine protease
MSPLKSRALAAAIYLLVADGVAALYLGGLLGLSGLGLVAVLVVGSWWQEPLRQRLAGVPRLGPVLLGVAGAGLVVEIAVGATGLLDVFTHLLIFLLLVKVYTLRTLRDARDVTFLSFFMLVATSPVTTSVVFLGLFVTFVVVGTWLLMFRHVLNEAAIVAGPTARIGREILNLALAGSVVTVLVTAVLFVVIPRVGLAALPLRTQASRTVSGFTEQVQLGAFGEIETDATVVMRVRLTNLTGGGVPEQLPSLRWRGIAFDHFDGRTWTVGRSTLKLTLRRNRPVPFPVHQYTGGPVLTQEIDLEPIESQMLFGAPRLLSVQARSEIAIVDDLGNVAVPSPAARLRYTVESERELGTPRAAGIAAARLPNDPRWQARYTQLPRLSPRIAALAREVTAGSADAHDAASRLSAWLNRELSYTRKLERPTGDDPLEDFLFVRRAGNCEYFAAALAVMLRSLQIPARVVNGFQRGEWNPYGGYFMVRLRDAHSWVEVFVDGAGWLTFDPSPRAPGEVTTPAAAAAMWLDSMRMSWHRYVVSFSLHDQLTAVESLRRATWTWGMVALRPREWPRTARLAAGGVALLVGATVALLWWRGRDAAPGAVVPAFYRQALHLLARRGLAPTPGETAREFAGRTTSAAWAGPLAALTTAYERVRFGGVVLTETELADVDTALAALMMAVRARRTSGSIGLIQGRD